MRKQEKINETLYVCSNLKYTKQESRTSNKSKGKRKNVSVKSTRVRAIIEKRENE